LTLNFHLSATIPI